MTDNNTKPTLDQLTHDALQLSLTDMEKLIERLMAERDARLKGLLPKSEHGQSEGQSEEGGEEGAQEK